MSRYTARLRQLEQRLRPGECRACAEWVIVNRFKGEDEHDVPPCGVCGQLPRQLVVFQPIDHDPDEMPTTPEVAARIQRAEEEYDELTRSQQPATVPTHPPLSSPESVRAAVDNNARAESQSKPRARRRRFYGSDLAIALSTHSCP